MEKKSATTLCPYGENAIVSGQLVKLDGQIWVVLQTIYRRKVKGRWTDNEAALSLLSDPFESRIELHDTSVELVDVVALARLAETL